MIITTNLPLELMLVIWHLYSDLGRRKMKEVKGYRKNNWYDRMEKNTSFDDFVQNVCSFNIL